MGRIVMRDLAELAPRAFELLLADRDRDSGERIARTLPRRVRVVEVDATKSARTARALRGATVIVNASHHSLNLEVMDAALTLGSHYCDLGGLFHVTREQLRRHPEF